jgi:hypothetical protein
MSTFLQLCQNLRSEAGISGTISSTQNQVGELARVVTWIRRAYRDIQNLYPNWNFLRTDFTFPTIASADTYLPTAVNIADHGAWKVDSLRCYLTSVGSTDEQWLDYVPWEDFRDTYKFGANRSITGRPIKVSVKPDQSLVFYPTPDDVYTIVGERFKSAQELNENADIPLIPAQYHDIIMWRALIFYGEFESAQEHLSTGEAEYKRLLRSLEARELPNLTIAGSLA